MLRASLAGVAIWLVAAAVAGGAPLPHNSPLYSPGGSPIVNENPEVSAVYQGKITVTASLPARGGVYRKAEMEWEMGVSGPVDQIEYTAVYGAQSIHWKLSKLTGTVEENETEAGGCKGTFSATGSDAGTGGVSVPAETPGHPAGGGDPATNADYSVIPPGGMPVNLLKSSGPQGSGCETSSWNGTGTTTWGNPVAFSQDPAIQSGWVDAVSPAVYFPPGGGKTQPVNFSYECAPPSCGVSGGPGDEMGSISVKVESSITFSSPGLGGGSPTTRKSKSGPREGKPPSPVTCPRTSKPTCVEKKAAQEDMQRLLPNLENQCAIAGIGTGLLVAGLAAPESGVAVVLAAAGPTGAEIFALSGPACALLIKRAYDDAKILEDPPIGHLDRLAQPAKRKPPANPLPPCTTFDASVRAFCESVRTDAGRYLAALQRTVALDGALVVTVDRVTGAAKAHRTSALREQRAHATLLGSQLRSASAQQRAAGAAIANLIRSQGLEMTLSGAQEQAGIAKAFSGAGRAHLSGKRFEHLTGLRLSATSTDFLAALSK